MTLRRLALSLLIYLLPFGLALLAACALAVRSGEAMPLWWVHAEQAADPHVIFQPADEELLLSYKLRGVERNRPSVVAIGSSRIRFFSSAPFRDPRAFYNAYVPSINLKQMTDFIFSLTPETAPDVMIVVLDVQRLRQRYPWPLAETVAGEMTPGQFALRVRRVMQELIAGRRTLDDVAGVVHAGEIRPLGLRAKTDGIGFFADGSAHFPETRTAAEVEERLALTRAQFAADDPAETTGQRVQEAAVDALRAALAHLQVLDVEIIGVVMPYTLPSLTAQMVGTPRYAPLFDAHQAALTLFASFDAPVYDYFDSRRFDMRDADIADGIHMTRAVSARVFADIIRRSPWLSTIADPLCAEDPDCRRPAR